MGCLQSKESKSGGKKDTGAIGDTSGGAGDAIPPIPPIPMTTIGRTERMKHHEESLYKTAPASESSRSKSSAAASTSTSQSKSTSAASASTAKSKQKALEIRKAKSALKKTLKANINERKNSKKGGPNLDESGRLTGQEISMRREISEQSNVATLVQGKTTIEYAYCTQRGYYPDDPHKPNQDAPCIKLSFANLKNDAFFAVFDGHGPVGEHFAQYAKAHLPTLLSTYIKQSQAQTLKRKNETLPKGSPHRKPLNPKFFAPLDEREYEAASRKAHVECNRKCLDTQPLVNLSGTTALSAAFHDGMITISNVGDSRAILGYKDIDYSNEHDNASMNESGSGSGSDALIAVPLSQDQTPWRKDERDRISSCGGRCMTTDEIQGKVEPSSKEKDSYGDRNLGEHGDIDIKGDPPRVWLADENIPGCSFTRSIGDSIADSVGVTGEPETFTKTITEEDKILVLASDGVFEFLPNQRIIDICAEYYDDGSPMVACEKVVDAAYEKWLEYENRTDDITAIIIFIRHF